MGDTSAWTVYWVPILTLLGQLVTIGVAVYAIFAWKGKHTGTEDHALARKLLIAAYRLRDAINHARNPISFREPENARNEGDIMDARRANMEEYTKRLQVTVEKRSRLELAITEAEAVWGEQVRDWFMPLIMLHTDVRVAVETHFELTDPTEGPLTADNQTLLNESNQIMFAQSMRRADAFEIRVNEALAHIRTHVRPRMVR